MKTPLAVRDPLAGQDDLAGQDTGLVDHLGPGLPLFGPPCQRKMMPKRGTTMQMMAETNLNCSEPLKRNMAFPGLQMSRDALSLNVCAKGSAMISMGLPGAHGSIAWRRWIQRAGIERSLPCGLATIQGIRSI